MAVIKMVLSAAIFSSAAYAQVPSPTVEEFDLNIRQEQIVETNFSRSTSLSKQTDKVYVEAGAAVSAGRIDVTLRGVTGHVRFRANFDALERLFRRP